MLWHADAILDRKIVSIHVIFTSNVKLQKICLQTDIVQHTHLRGCFIAHYTPIYIAWYSHLIALNDGNYR